MSAPLNLGEARAEWAKQGPTTGNPIAGIVDFADEWVPRLLDHAATLEHTLRRIAFCEVLHPAAYARTVLAELDALNRPVALPDGAA